MDTVERADRQAAARGHHDDDGSGLGWHLADHRHHADDRPHGARHLDHDALTR